MSAYNHHILYTYQYGIYTICFSKQRNARCYIPNIDHIYRGQVSEKISVPKRIAGAVHSN